MRNFTKHKQNHNQHDGSHEGHRSHQERRFHHDDERHDQDHHGRRHSRRRHGSLSGGDHNLLTRGRKLSSDELQLLILRQLDTQPAHGYELIKYFEEHSNGMYTPSPGVIYPALTYLNETDKVSVEQQGNRKQYFITDEGKKQLAQSQEQAQFLWNRLGSIGTHMNEIRDIFAEKSEKSREYFQFFEASKALKIALRQKQNSSEEELKRIESILQKAVEEILEPSHNKE